VLKSKLNGQNKIQPINTYFMPVLSYTEGVIEWTQSEVEELDRKPRKTLNNYEGLHPRSDTHRLYLQRQNGGRGLKEMKATIQEEKKSALQNVQGIKRNSINHNSSPHGYPVLAQTEYLNRQNDVTRAIHKNILEEYDLETVTQPWLQKPETVTENAQVKILWNFEVGTDNIIPERRQDNYNSGGQEQQQQ
jgi:hypothetical protein